MEKRFLEEETTSTLAPMHEENEGNPVGETRVESRGFRADPVRGRRWALARALSLLPPRALASRSRLRFPLRVGSLGERRLCGVLRRLLAASPFDENSWAEARLTDSLSGTRGHQPMVVAA